MGHRTRRQSLGHPGGNRRGGLLRKPLPGRSSGTEWVIPVFRTRPRKRGRATQDGQGVFHQGGRGRSVRRAALVLGWGIVTVFLGSQTVRAEAPHIDFVFPAGAKQGATLEVTVGGEHLQGITAVRVSGEGVTGEILEVVKPDPKKKKRIMTQTGDKEPEVARVRITVSADAVLGRRELRLVSPEGLSNAFAFFVGRLAEIVEKEPNDTLEVATDAGAIPAVVNGQILSGDRDWIRFRAEAGQTVVCAVQARAIVPYIADGVPGWFQAVLGVYDTDGRELAYVDDWRFDPDPLLIYKIPKTGTYALKIHDSIYRGREDFIYRLTIGAIPFVTDVYPLGGPPGADVKVTLAGANLPQPQMTFKTPRTPGRTRWAPLGRVGLTWNTVAFDVDDRPQAFEAEPNDKISQAQAIREPIVIDGRIEKPGDTDLFKIQAKARQPVVVEVRARRLGSPLDSIVTVWDLRGRRLAVNDDWKDPGEGWLTHHADSRLEYTFRTAGTYLVRLQDIQGKGGPEYAYRLVISRPQPDYALRATPDAVVLPKGGTGALRVRALRDGGFDGPINLKIEGLGAGFSTQRAVVPAGQTEAQLTIKAPADAALGIHPIGVAGTARLGGRTVKRRAVPCEDRMQAFIYHHLVPSEELAVMITPPAAFTLALEKADGVGGESGGVVSIVPGGTAKVAVRAVRRKGLQGPIVLTAANLPKGLTVRRAVIPKDQNRVEVVLAATKQLKPGLETSVVLTGTSKQGKTSHTAVAPAFGVRIVAPKAAGGGSKPGQGSR